MNRVTRKAFADAVVARLAGIPNLTSYRSFVPKTPPTISEDDLRVKPYVAAFFSAGVPGWDPRLAGDSNGLGFTFQLKCVSGRETDVEQTIEVVTNAFELWSLIPNPPLADARQLGRCRQINDPGMPVPDKGETPVRFFSDLIYRIGLSA